jgi:hypothetical protein
MLSSWHHDVFDLSSNIGWASVTKAKEDVAALGLTHGGTITGITA